MRLADSAKFLGHSVGADGRSFAFYAEVSMVAVDAYNLWVANLALTLF
jgi:hypothetical protein